MALVNHAKREINAKIVYYGHEGAGKSASLQYIYDRIKPSLRGELKSLPTGGNNLLFFDFSPFEKPVFGGYRLRFHMYSLIGKVANQAAWKMTLKGADGLVVVADASPEQLPVARENISLLRDSLGAYGASLIDLPSVLQLNRVGSGLQTLETVTAADLGVPEMPSCHSDSVSGVGVLEGLSLLSREVVNRIGQSDALRKPALDGVAGDDEESGPSEIDDVSATPDVLSVQASPVGSNDEKSTIERDVVGVTEEVQVALAGDGAEIVGGVVRVPLEITIGAATRRLVLSIAIGPA